ncbi:MAG: 2-polyprenyl-3-methyl-5-hydroxy-6-metoxy-1,4-benzoquinol methylase [Granulosicoccus sp.]|jgi:2-polyprenyl-3-methyl-5-hydroxy-6-metoxy-1,4-benzoquinol methylase
MHSSKSELNVQVAPSTPDDQATNPGALPDDFYDKKDVYYQATRPELLPYFPQDGKTVLDVGCGEGWFGDGLKRTFGAEVWGVDISEASIAIAENNLDKALLADVTTNLELLPDSYFDIIYFNDVLEHMVDPYTLLSNISAKLSDNGIVVASIPNIMHHKVLWNLIFKHDFRYENAGVMDETHLRWFTRKSMMRLFSDAGFINVKTDPVFKTKSFRPLVMQIATLGLIGRDISYPQFIVSAKKAKP